MKNFTLLIAGLFSLGCLAQNNDTDLNTIVEAEMKSGLNLINFTANINTGNYDVTHHTLEFTVDPAEQFVTGIVTTTFTALENMETITFDLDDNLTVSTVTKNGTVLSFDQNNNDELVITFPTIQQEGTEGTVVIHYSGAPSWEQEAFVAGFHGDSPVLWTLSEPYGAKDWWPCKQDLNDKVDDGIDVYITAPSQYVSVSNGVEQSQQVNGNGTKTTYFKHNYPIPAYLIAIAVSNYSVYTIQAGTAPNTFPIVNYIYPEFLPSVQSQLDSTVPIMDFYEATFETYPFHEEKYGHAQCGFGGGMEHTTVSFMGGFSRELIAHELAHQWFGDKITCGSWKDIWLNEGFATYLSGLVVEEQDGDFEFRSWRFNRISSITAAPDGSVYLTDNDTLDSGRIFSSRLTYNKGAMVAHMLRFKLGDTAFYQALKNYLADANLAYGYAKTPDLQAHLEETSGVELDEFFNDWVYNQGYPSYNADVLNTPGTALLTLSQVQSHPSVDFFEGPVPIRFYGVQGEVLDYVANHTENNQQFTISVPFTISSVEVNADYDIISAANTVSLTLGTDKVSLLNSIKLYPNPTSGQLNLQLPAGITIEEAVFYNTLGQEVLKGGGETSWNVNRLASGIHFIKLVTNQGSTQLKFIKE
ncbi:T9SS type A sorting domain-containing protein [Flavobacterium zepuense]|uniref:Aminopeptidase N n=1 Tax=Flavobacterium zepuense TaxID=2593302 RepID=A0A552UX92_9FLAO|nr:M1 family aminopeptidase [Flavobacterium zepuense]TRW22827.1 T9SS type A sorting domain-containing protein [Flavobacterium zepuense]